MYKLFIFTIEESHRQAYLVPAGVDQDDTIPPFAVSVDEVDLTRRLVDLLPPAMGVYLTALSSAIGFKRKTHTFHFDPHSLQTIWYF
jgi:hypothetical protein